MDAVLSADTEALWSAEGKNTRKRPPLGRDVVAVSRPRGHKEDREHDVSNHGGPQQRAG
jgi:hypothetical protein